MPTSNTSDDCACDDMGDVGDATSDGSSKGACGRSKVIMKSLLVTFGVLGPWYIAVTGGDADLSLLILVPSLRLTRDDVLRPFAASEME